MEQNNFYRKLQSQPVPFNVHDVAAQRTVKQASQRKSMQ